MDHVELELLILKNAPDLPKLVSGDVNPRKFGGKGALIETRSKDLSERCTAGFQRLSKHKLFRIKEWYCNEKKHHGV